MWIDKCNTYILMMMVLNCKVVSKGHTHRSHQSGLAKVVKDTTIPSPTKTQETMGTSARIPPVCQTEITNYQMKYGHERYILS